jgi:hypothetical protein
MIKQILRLHYEGILLFILFMLLQIFSLTDKMSPIHPNILMYDTVIIYMVLEYIIILNVY